MFNEYFQLGNRIRKHYISPRVFLCLVTGRFVPPIHRKNLYSLQYSMLPAHRAGIGELWTRLMTRDGLGKGGNAYPGSKDANGYAHLAGVGLGRRGVGANGGVHGRRW